MDEGADDALYTDRVLIPGTATERAPTREEMSELLAGVAAASRSVRGRLKALAHVVRVLRHCPWVTGTLLIDLEGDGEDTTLVHLIAEADGRRERALPSAVLDVPLEQVHAAIHSNPDLLALLRT